MGTLKRYYNSWLTEKKKEFTNGYCIYYANPCGTKFVKQEDGTYKQGNCGSLPTDCNEGFVMRVIDENTKRCVEACGAGEGYETADIDTCVSCSSGASEGVDDIGTCVRCESDEFFVKPENGSRWYDKDPVISMTVELLRVIPPENQRHNK